MAQRVVQTQVGSGKIRNQAISPDLENLLNAIGNELDIYFEVTSGGQSSHRDPKMKGKPGGWTGSHRHDDGGAADVKIYQIKDGKKSYADWTTKDGQALWSNATRLARAGGATGLGAGLNYMGPQSVHIGYGNEAVWGGAGKNAAAAPAWLVEAAKAGKRTPPMNIPQVATATDTSPRPMIRPASLSIPSSVPAIPKPRPGNLASVNSKLGATGGAMEPAARLVTSGLGWKNGDFDPATTDVRSAIPIANSARARLTAASAPVDPRLSALSVPQVPKALRADPVGAGPLSFSALQGLGGDPAYTQVASLDPSIGVQRTPPVPMPGRAPVVPTAPVPMQRPVQQAKQAPVPMPARPVAAPPMPRSRPVTPMQVPQVPAAVPRTAVATQLAVTPPAGNDFFGGLMGGINNLKDQAGGLINSAVTAVQPTLGAAQTALTEQLPAMVMASPKMRGAFIDPYVARLFTSTPMNRSPTRYGTTAAERQASAARRESLMNMGSGVPALPPSRTAVATERSVTPKPANKPEGYGSKGYSEAGKSLLEWLGM